MNERAETRQQSVAQKIDRRPDRLLRHFRVDANDSSTVICRTPNAVVTPLPFDSAERAFGRFNAMKPRNETGGTHAETRSVV